MIINCGGPGPEGEWVCWTEELFWPFCWAGRPRLFPMMLKLDAADAEHQGDAGVHLVLVGDTVQVEAALPIAVKLAQQVQRRLGEVRLGTQRDLIATATVWPARGRW